MPVLRALPDWFGIEEALQHYAEAIDQLPTFLASNGAEVTGFASIKLHNPFSAEIYVMGVSPQHHRGGVGRRLLRQAEDWLRGQGIEYLQVKTLSDSHPDPGYAQTRAFYLALGFRPLEELKQLWNEENPCLVLVKRL